MDRMYTHFIGERSGGFARCKSTAAKRRRHSHCAATGDFRDHYEHMTIYSLDASHLRPIVALVAAHGATDFATSTWPLAYAVCCIIPSVCVTPVFVLGSIVHFSEDIGFGSLLLHAVAGLVWWRGGTQRGLELMLAYLGAFHTPSHYLRCWRRGRRAALLAASGTTALMAWWLLRLHCVGITTLSIDHSIQRVVVAHVLTEWYVSRANGLGFF